MEEGKDGENERRKEGGSQHQQARKQQGRESGKKRDWKGVVVIKQVTPTKLWLQSEWSLLR